MKLDFPERTIESNIQNGKTIDFKLDNNSPILFQILRSKMYSDPIKAICREIGSNARDANREVGKQNTPIQIWLPGESIIFKDQGPGISPDRMEEVFCYYGRSTKRDDNNQTGGYGLGAKTPFSLVDQFVIETTVDGIKYTYVAKIDESYKGNIDLLGQEYTGESSGTSIKIPVNPSDKHLFCSAIYEVTKFWKVQPKFVGHLQSETLKPTLESEGWAIYLKDVNGSNVLVDEIPYKDYQTSIPPRVVLKFNTGEISLSSNRESLHYDSKTHEAIKEALRVFNEEVEQQVQRQLDEVETFGEVISVIDSIPNARFGSHNWTWKGHSFTYPFAKNLVVFERPRRKLTHYHTRIVDRQVSDVSFVELDKGEITSYDRQKIGSYLQNHGLNRVYLVEPYTLPVKAVKLSTLKVIRPSSGPRQKVVKTTIKARSSGARRHRDYLIDTDRVMVYVTSDISTIRSAYNIANGNLVQIAERDIKHIEDEENWLSLEEYLQQKLYDKYTTEEIQNLVDRHAGKRVHDAYCFLSVYHEDFAFLGTKVSKSDDELNNIISYLIDNKIFTAQPMNIWEKYPMLKLSRYVSHEDRQTVRNYVDLINSQENKNV